MSELPIDGIPTRFTDKFRVLPDECWEWTAYRDKDGYGRFGLDGRVQLAHRAAYEWYVGPIPDGLTIDHLCRNRACVNPAHLEPVTHRENVLRGDTFAAEHAAKTHCPQGHPYDDENTWVHRGGRHCRECNRTRSREYQRQRRARL